MVVSGRTVLRIVTSHPWVSGIPSTPDRLKTSLLKGLKDYEVVLTLLPSGTGTSHSMFSAPNEKTVKPELLLKVFGKNSRVAVKYSDTKRSLSEQNELRAARKLKESHVPMQQSPLSLQE